MFPYLPENLQIAQKIKYLNHCHAGLDPASRKKTGLPGQPVCEPGNDKEEIATPRKARLAMTASC